MAPRASFPGSWLSPLLGTPEKHGKTGRTLAGRPLECLAQRNIPPKLDGALVWLERVCSGAGVASAPSLSASGRRVCWGGGGFLGGASPSPKKYPQLSTKGAVFGV